jgi:hypothetical protein
MDRQVLLVSLSRAVESESELLCTDCTALVLAGLT